MGLDTFASRSEEISELSGEDIKAFENENINLCEGLFTDGEASFRGKVYANVVLEITGISLFEYWIPLKQFFICGRHLRIVILKNMPKTILE